MWKISIEGESRNAIGVAVSLFETNVADYPNIVCRPRNPRKVDSRGKKAQFYKARTVRVARNGETQTQKAARFFEEDGSSFTDRFRSRRWSKAILSSAFYRKPTTNGNQRDR